MSEKKEKKKGKGFKIAIGVVCVFVLIGVFGGGNDTKESAPATTQQTEQQAQQAVEQTIENQQESQSEATKAEQNALKAAKQYLSVMAFSYDGLVGQLEYDGYTAEEAKYRSEERRVGKEC